MLEFRGHGHLMVCSIKDNTKRKAALTWLYRACRVSEKKSCKRAEILPNNCITWRCLARLEIFVTSPQTLPRPLQPKIKWEETLTLVDLISGESQASNLKALPLVTRHFTPPIPTQRTSLWFYFSEPLITWAPRFNKHFNPFLK